MTQAAQGPVLFAVRRIGPYHHVRLEAFGQRQPLAVLETRPASREYPWDFDPGQSYPIHRLSGHHNPDSDPPATAVDHQVAALLTRLRPRAVVCVGWADRALRRLLLAAQRRAIPCVIVSDSRANDSETPRRWPLEQIKRLLLRGYGAGLVAGRESRAYLEALGMPADAIHQPWDVVDNAGFAAAAERERRYQAALAAEEREPPHFLCVSRFIEKKNHAGLLQAYGDYQRQGGRWGLRLLGCGPLQERIAAQIATLPQPQRVRLDPFQQLVALQRCYGQAHALVLASHTDQWGLVVNEAMAAGLPVLLSAACGCAGDLVEHGVSGWCFPPAGSSALTALLHTAEQQSPEGRAAMVASARERLQAFSPESFASGLSAAVKEAIERRRRSRLAMLTAQALAGF